LHFVSNARPWCQREATARDIARSASKGLSAEGGQKSVACLGKPRSKPQSSEIVLQQSVFPGAAFQHCLLNAELCFGTGNEKDVLAELSGSSWTECSANRFVAFGAFSQTKDQVAR
jgi:hypothetical protein